MGGGFLWLGGAASEPFLCKDMVIVIELGTSSDVKPILIAVSTNVDFSKLYKLFNCW